MKETHAEEWGWTSGSWFLLLVSLASAHVARLQALARRFWPAGGRTSSSAFRAGAGRNPGLRELLDACSGCARCRVGQAAPASSRQLLLFAQPRSVSPASFEAREKRVVGRRVPVRSARGFSAPAQGCGPGRVRRAAPGPFEALAKQGDLMGRRVAGGGGGDAVGFQIGDTGGGLEGYIVALRLERLERAAFEIVDAPSSAARRRVSARSCAMAKAMAFCARPRLSAQSRVCWSSSGNRAD